ncbi:MAG TPA: carboxypeptidase-like regulatory domain-containing protein [Verrucomicrobiae bacterium]|nr:carboxypeptidase-like regulatory domain-containing protein [Verrucomicrobiae bacterium]
MKQTICALAAMLMLAGLIGAQENRGTIQGTVKDPQGAMVSGANVTITNTDTKTIVKVVTNTLGRYTAPLLMPGNYTVMAELAGFKKDVHTGITLLTAEVRDVDFTLQVGAASESVTVTGEAPLIDVSHTDNGTAMDERTVRDLPVMTDVATSLIQFAAGVNSGAGAEQILGPHSTQGGSDYNNGTGVGGNVWTIDGAFSNGNGRNTSNLPSVSLVDEVKVVDNTFDGSFGHSTGLGISITTKSGSNQFHGDASENYWSQRWQGSNLFVKKQYFTNIDSLNAKGQTGAANAAAALPIQASGHSNLYGVTGTGPLWIPHIIDKRNKVFWTFSYTGEHDAKPETSNSYSHVVPTAADKTGNFSDMLKVTSDGLNYQLFDPLSVRVDTSRSGTHYIRTPIPGNVLPASYMNMGAPFYKPYLKYWPDPNNWFDPTLALNAGSTDGQFVNTPYNWLFGSYSGRMDINLTDKLRVFGRYTRNHFVEYRSDWTYFIVKGWNNSGANGTGVTRDDQNGVLDFVYTVSPRTMLHVAGSVSNWMSYTTTLPYAFQFKPSDAGLPTYLNDYCGNWCYLPLMSISGYSTNGIGGTPGPQYNRFFDYYGDLYYNRGNHQFHFGGDFRQETRSIHNGNNDGQYTFGNTYFREYDDAGPNGNYNPATLGLSWASYMMGLPTSNTISDSASYLVSNQFLAFYGQDTWRVKPNLTLTLTLRAEWENGAKGAQNNYIVGWNPTAQLPVSSAVQAAYAANTASQVPELPASSFSVTGGPLYAGTQGAPSRMWNSQLVWLPRIGVGYQINSKTVLRGGYGVYYDTLDVNALVLGLNQTGYSVNTGTTFTTTQGVTWGSNGTNCGAWCNLGTTLTSPLTDPFPVRSTNNSTRFNYPVGNTYGLMNLLALANGPSSWAVPASKHPRMQRWRAAIERQLTSHDLLTFGYTGAWTSDLNVQTNLSALPASYYFLGLARPVNSAGSTLACASGVTNATAGFCLEDTNFGANVPNPFYIGNLSALQTSNPALYGALSTVGSFFTSTTISKATLLRAYPSSNYSIPNPIGQERETNLDASIVHRFNRGLSASFNYSYFHGRIANSYEQAWNPNDPSNPQSLWWLPNNVNPNRFTATWVYDLPFGKGRHWVNNSTVLDALVGGWIVSGNYLWSQGTLIAMPNAFYYGNPNGIKLSNPTFGEWFNTAGCLLPGQTLGPGDVAVPLGQPCTQGWDKRTAMQPGTYQARIMPLYVDGVRNPNFGVLSASLARDFKFHIKDQTLTFQLRGDVINLENHSYFNGPNTGVTGGVGTFGAITSGSTVLNRFIQVQGHIRW